MSNITQADWEHRWQSSTAASFEDADMQPIHHFDPSDSERIFAFQSCEEILFQDGKGGLTLFQRTGSGEMKLPPGIQVRAKGGAVKCL